MVALRSLATSIGLAVSNAAQGGGKVWGKEKDEDCRADDESEGLGSDYETGASGALQWWVIVSGWPELEVGDRPRGDSAVLAQCEVLLSAWGIKPRNKERGQ